MPLGGYCTVCQRWVWLTPYGECQNGHPALAVKDVQQLKPQAEADVLVGEVLEEGKPRARFRWWWRHSAWILWMFTLGFMNWLGFVYVGVRARHTPWVLLRVRLPGPAAADHHGHGHSTADLALLPAAAVDLGGVGGARPGDPPVLQGDHVR